MSWEDGTQTAAQPLSPAELDLIHAWWRAANYLSVGQIYLLDNPLLERPLERADIKPRLLGHWGTTTTTPFDMVVRNDLDRFHLVSDVIDRVPKLGYLAAYAKQEMRDKLIEPKQYITRYGDDMPEVKQWRWPEATGV